MSRELRHVGGKLQFEAIGGEQHLLVLGESRLPRPEDFAILGRVAVREPAVLLEVSLILNREEEHELVELVADQLLHKALDADILRPPLTLVHIGVLAQRGV